MRVVFQTTYAQLNLLTGIYNRNTISLDNKWRYIVDPLKLAFIIITGITLVLINRVTSKKG